MRLFKKKNDLYLSDRQPLTFMGIIGLLLSYGVLFAWAFVILWPLAQMVIASLNGNQTQYLNLNTDEFVFRLNISCFYLKKPSI